ncbi:penicillin acylase family protein [Silvibacterium dinghuense]|uniref:Penicillin acylase family protein n=1 Tax=Silvibacterium dinghuense TaxID=1560006 RepID=A0A4Q1SB61_9BACT|nr:penicillin acylase family protein [Silvibacterium dinghuense]RXS94368.1 penicillin acylase family protein [Silvibacterium dinghuense]
MPVSETRRRPVLRVLIVLLFLLVVLAAAAVLGAGLWLRHAMTAALPQLDGSLPLPGLSAPVTVRRDQHGVPHIEAANLDDLFEAQGYVTAQDRLWEMDMARRLSAGEAAEILGSKLVEHDRVQRVLQIRPTAERMVASLNARDRRYFEDYARGVNAFITANQDHLSPEFRLLMYSPKPWKPVDSVLVMLSMMQMLDQHWESKLEREQVTARLGPTLAATLYPDGSWRDHPPTQVEPDLTAPNQIIPDAPLDETQVKAEDLLHLKTLLEGPRAACAGCTPGSNQWVVSGALTASGKPLLSNDMHLNHQIPNIWFELDLNGPGFHAAGVTVPGIPYIVAGHNEHISWGFTALYADMQDIYVEQLNNQDQYRSISATGAVSWQPVEHDHETIHVRGGSDVPIDVERTVHGPILTPLIPNEKRALALRWNIYDPKSGGDPLFDLNTAANWDDFRRAMSGWYSPSQNVVYSDDQGHIGYQAVGYIPLRPAGIAPTTIADTNHEWQGFIPFEQLPSAYDPANGILATANARTTPDGYPYPITDEWADPYRNERIWKWLAGHAGAGQKLTPADMLTLQTDVYSEVDQELAQRFAYAIDHAGKTDSRLREAADLLRSWDGVVSIDSAPAAIIADAKKAFWPMLLKPRIGDDWKLYEWSSQTFAMEEFINHRPAAWLPSEYKTWDDFLADVVRTGIREKHGDLKHWKYGEQHPVDVEHPLYSMLPWFKRWTGTGKQPQAGDTTTVKQAGSTFGPSQRFTMDWSNPDQSTENIVMGESGDPLSPYYRDHWPYWYSGKTFALPFSSQAVASQTTHTLRLTP